MKAKRSIWTPLVFGAFLALFLAVLSNLSKNMRTLMDMTNITQGDVSSVEKQGKDMKNSVHVRNGESRLFRGKIVRSDGVEKAQNGVSGSGADLPSDSVLLDKIASDQTPTDLDNRRSDKVSEKTSPRENGPSDQFYFAVHYASYKDLADAKMEVAKLSDEGFHAKWIETDAPDKGKWFRVYIGKERTRQEAKKLALTLKGDQMIEEIFVHKLESD